MKALTAIGLGFVACGHSPTPVAPSAPALVTELTIERPTAIDVLIVLDNSPSMAGVDAATSMSDLVTTLAGSQTDFQLGVTTTDATCDAGGVVGDGKCGRLFSPDAGDPVLRSRDYADKGLLVDRFQQIANAVGASGSASPQGLQTADEAIAQTGTGQANAGLVRSGALLVILFVSNGDDSGGTDITKLAANILGSKGDPRLVTVGVAAGAVIDPATNTATAAACSGDSATASPSTRYLAFAAQWSATLVTSICQSGFADRLYPTVDLAVDDCFALAAAPPAGDPKNVQVLRRPAGEMDFTAAPLLTLSEQALNDDGWVFSALNSGDEACMSGAFRPAFGDTYRIVVNQLAP